MRYSSVISSYAGAEAICAAEGARLVKIADEGVRSIVTRVFEEFWAGKLSMN